MKAPTLKQRFQYWLDNYMSRGAGALIGGLAVVSVVIISIAALILVVGGRLLAPAGEEPPGFIEAFWLSLMRTLDAGTMGGDAGWGFRIVMLLVTIGGVFVVSALIGVLSAGLEDRLEELRKGRSLVLESDHTLILGWTPQIFTILSELVTANESRKSGAVIVVMAEQDKVEMEDEIRARVEDTKNTKIICRSGSPLDLSDLEIGSPHTARAIVILPEGEDPDTHVIKSTLAMTNNPNRADRSYHIVTQIRDPKNLDVMKLLGARDLVQPILSNDLIARLTAQTSRQSGLSVVYTELMNFGGDEIYFKEEPVLVGKTYGEALLAFESSAPLGVCRADGGIYLNPPMDFKIEPGDQIFAVAADEDKLILDGAPQVDEAVIRFGGKASPPKAERALILGWNDFGATVVRELDSYVAEGSQVTVVADLPDFEARLEKEAANLKNQKLVALRGDIRDRSLLDSLQVTEYDHVMVLAYHHLEPQQADAITLVALLHLRDIAEKDETPFSIVSEMLDLRNRALAEAANVDDFIVSDHLVSLATAQIAEEARLMGVFSDLFDPQGAEIYLKPVGDYVETGKPVNFYSVVEAARRRGETAFGYRVARESHRAEASYGVRVNPKKSEKITFAPEDKIVILAEG